MTRFDVDEMMTLAQTSPELFAQRRAELLKQSLDRFSDPVAGQRLQDEIDTRRLCGSSQSGTCLLLLDRTTGAVRELDRLVRELKSKTGK